MRHSTLAALALLFLAGTARAQGRVEPRWESIDRRPTPAWFEDAQLGIFIHWGAYAVPSFAPRTEVGVYARYSEWYWKRLATPDMEGHKEFKAFHDRVYGPETVRRRSHRAGMCPGVRGSGFIEKLKEAHPSCPKK